MNIENLIKESKLPRLEAETLLAFLINKQREFIIVHRTEKIAEKTIKKFKELENKRLNNWPLAYLTGHKEFYSLDFEVNKNVLVPRPETEILIETILNYIPKQKTSLDFLDIGTGSGAIIITLAKEIKKQLPSSFDNSSFLGLDISAAALKVARKNAKLHSLNKKIAFIESDLLDKLPVRTLENSHLVIAANLPYLTPKQAQEEPSIRREPKLALDGGPDGLKYYRALFWQLKKIKFTSLFLICEINPEQVKNIKILAKKNLPQANLKIIKDLNRQSRFISIALN